MPMLPVARGGAMGFRADALADGSVEGVADGFAVPNHRLTVFETVDRCAKEIVGACMATCGGAIMT